MVRRKVFEFVTVEQGKERKLRVVIVFKVREWVWFVWGAKGAVIVDQGGTLDS